VKTISSAVMANPVLKQKLSDFLKNRVEKGGGEKWLDKLYTWITSSYSERVNTVKVNGSTLQWLVLTPSRSIAVTEPFCKLVVSVNTS
jgi:hypothetical protein